MSSPQEGPHGYRFGPNLCWKTGELYLNGKFKQRLTGQPRQLLWALLEQEGAIVNKQGLKAALWPDRNVDIPGAQKGLVKVLREILGDEEKSCIVVDPREGVRIGEAYDVSEAPAELFQKLRGPRPKEGAVEPMPHSPLLSGTPEFRIQYIELEPTLYQNPVTLTETDVQRDFGRRCWIGASGR
jgi:DNA-binding winged helix-turn-helix (wHTH) protein